MTTEEHVVSTLSRRNLPNGWTFSTISGLVSAGGVFVDGDWVETEDQDPTGEVRLVQLADVGDGYYRDRSKRFLTYKKALELRCTFLRHNDLLIARMPDPLGRACIFPGDPKASVTVVDVCIVRTGDIGADHRWLMYTINSPDVRAAIASLQSGSTRKRISRKNLAKIQIPVPPLPEQQLIVAEIETQFTRLDAGVAALKRVQAKLRRYKAALLKAACEGRLVPTEAELARVEGREYEPADVLLQRILAERRAKWQQANPGKRYVEPKGVEVEGLAALPEGWVWATVEQLGEVRLGRQRSPKNHFGPHMRPYLRAANATWDGVDVSDVMEMNFSPTEFETYRLRRGDILLAEASGSADEVGKPFIWNEQIADCCFQNTLIRVRLDYLEPSFLHLHFRKDALTGRFATVAKGVGIHHLGAERLAVLPVMLPPLAEQHRIVAEVERRLSVAQEVESTVAASLRRAERLRQSILKQAFAGRLGTPRVGA